MDEQPPPRTCLRAHPNDIEASAPRIAARVIRNRTNNTPGKERCEMENAARKSPASGEASEKLGEETEPKAPTP